MTKKLLASTKAQAQAGFSLVELMVVVTIIGILAGIAMPKVQTSRARAAQTESKSGLNGIFMAASSYQANYNEFPTAAASTDVTTITALSAFTAGGVRKYNYRYISTNPTEGWAATATSTRQLANNMYDHWRINTNKWLCAPFNAVDNQLATPQVTGKTSLANVNCPQSVAGTANTLAAVYIVATDAP